VPSLWAFYEVKRSAAAHSSSSRASSYDSGEDGVTFDRSMSWNFRLVTAVLAGQIAIACFRAAQRTAGEDPAALLPAMRKTVDLLLA
jgi:hypothetical protein